MADTYAGTYCRLDTVLMVSHHECGCQFVGISVQNTDGGEYSAQYMCLYRLLSIGLFHLRQDDHSGLCPVLVLGGEDFLHLVVQVVTAADVRHALDDLVVVDSPYRIAVDVVLLVGTLECFKVHYFDSVVLEIKLSLIVQCC